MSRLRPELLAAVLDMSVLAPVPLPVYVRIVDRIVLCVRTTANIICNVHNILTTCCLSSASYEMHFSRDALFSQLARKLQYATPPSSPHTYTVLIDLIINARRGSRKHIACCSCRCCYFHLFDITTQCLSTNPTRLFHLSIVHTLCLASTRTDTQTTEAWDEAALVFSPLETCANSPSLGGGLAVL